MLVALAAHHRWPIFHMDAITTFWNGEFKEDDYITQPQGFSKQGSEHLVCKLKKALYGLKQTPKTWYNKIDSYLKDLGFCKGEGDYNLFVVKDKGNIVLLLLYVDDVLFEQSQVD